MLDFLTRLFDTSDFPARWSCGNWSSGHGWLHVLSDLGVWSAYVAIPCVLGYFLLRRRDLPFRAIFLLFGAFILACGTTHLMEAAIFWWPAYRLAGVIKLFTAVVSWATVIALVPVVPKAMAMRSPEELEREVEARTAELRLERERFRTTLASIGDAVIATDPEGRVSFLNPVASALTGWREEAAGRALPEVFRIVNEQTAEPVESPVEKVLREGGVVGLANHTVLIAKDGTKRPIDDSAAPIKDERGRVSGVVLIFRDVAERRRQETLLRESEERFRNMADSAPVMIWVTDPSASCTYLNRQWYTFTGTAAEQGLGAGWLEVVHPDDRGRAGAVFLAANERREGFRLEYRLRRHDGAYRWAIDSATPRFGPGGEFLGYIGSVLDIDERKALEEQLRERAEQLAEADRKKDDFLAVLAHELRNPLAPIRNGLEVMRLAGTNGEAAEQARSMMERQLGQMVHLVDDLLDVSRISRGKIELRRERVELTAVVGSAVETSAPVIEGQGHELTVTLPDEPVYVDADKTRLAQALCNLLSNAAKYTERGGRISLSVEREGGEAVLRVRDTGIGIPGAMLPKVFEMFTQVDRSLEKAQGGLGIGLTIVKRLVEMHGGAVEAHSDGPGKGSEFVVRLPVAPAPPTTRPAQGDGGGSAVAAMRKVLVVDDNRDSASSLAMMLKLMGHEVRTAHDGLQAVEAAEAFRPHLILMDVGMPRLNGFDATRRIRQQPWGKGVVIVALTGWGQDEDKRKSQDAGCDCHMVKPVDPAALEGLLAGLPAAATNRPAGEGEVRE